MSHRTRRLLAPALLGVAGTATLTALCLWQLQRLEWKLGLIATLEQRLSAPPLDGLPATLDPAEDEFRRVVLAGTFEGAPGAHGHPDAPLLATYGKEGAGYRIIQPLTLPDGRKVMVSRGWVPLEAKNEGGRAVRPTPGPAGEVTITGALRWPDDPQSPAYGPNDNVWVARDLAAMRELFGVEPVLVVAETPTPGPDGRAPRPTPLTVDLPNNHAGYAFTWGLLAAVWASMSALWGFREMRRG